MSIRPQDQRWSRFIGPEDRAQGEWRGHRVTILRELDADHYSVRFPCGTVSKVHHNHLTFPFIRQGAPIAN